MLRALQEITNINGTSSYVHNVHRAFQSLSTKAASNISENLQAPVKLRLIFRTHQSASPSQVCAYQTVLREIDRLQMAKFISASQTARFFSEAVSTLLLNASEEPMEYPVINQSFTPEGMLRLPPENAPINQLRKPSQSLPRIRFKYLHHRRQ